MTVVVSIWSPASSCERVVQNGYIDNAVAVIWND